MANEFIIPVFYGTFSNLTKIDLSFINAEIVVYKSSKFSHFFKQLFRPEDFDYLYSNVSSDLNEMYVYEDEKIKRYAILPTDAENPLTQEKWLHFHQLMLSIYPSDFTLVQEIPIYNLDGYYQTSGKSFYPFRESGQSAFDRFLYIGKNEFRFVNKYLKTHFHTSFKLGYVKYMLSVYSNSFFENNRIYQYISLIICLEVSLEGNEQLSYRLKRNTALLCGDSVESCKRIFENVNQLYKLRSAIVHGNIKPSYKHFQEYLEYLKTLVARLIRELIVHNIPTLEELNIILTTLGYGQNRKISKNYVSSKYPLLGNIELSYKAIQKYK